MATRATHTEIHPLRTAVALLAALALLVVPGCGSSGGSEKQTGPLSATEKAYIRNAEKHAKLVQKVDPFITAAVLRAKVQRPSESGLPAQMMNATQKKLGQRRKLIRTWDKIDCPSQRARQLCGLWHDQLNLQYRWDDRLIQFINRPYTKARFTALLNAGRRQTQQWRRCQGEIRKLERASART